MAPPGGAMPSRPMDSSALILDDTTVRFDDVTALDGLSMELPAGALVGLVGP